MGPVWLYAIGSGFFAFAAWRLVQAVFDTEGEGRSLAGLVRRAGWGISGLLHGALGYSALDLSDNVTAFHPGYPGHDAFERVLATPFGGGILLVVGALVAAAALGNAAKALSRRLERHLDCPGGSQVLGRAGGAGGPRAGHVGCPVDGRRGQALRLGLHRRRQGQRGRLLRRLRLALVRPGGLLAVDNALWNGAVADAAADARTWWRCGR